MVPCWMLPDFAGGFSVSLLPDYVHKEIDREVNQDGKYIRQEMRITVSNEICCLIPECTIGSTGSV